MNTAAHDHIEQAGNESRPEIANLFKHRLDLTQISDFAELAESINSMTYRALGVLRVIEHSADEFTGSAIGAAIAEIEDIGVAINAYQVINGGVA